MAPLISASIFPCQTLNAPSLPIYRLPQFCLLDLAGGVPRNLAQEDLSGPFVFRQFLTVFENLFFGEGFARNSGHHHGNQFTQSLVRVTNGCHILHARMGMEEVFDLDGEDILPADDDHILLSVHDIDKAIFILSRHVSCIEPSILQGSRRGFRVLVILPHHPVAAKKKLAGLPLADILPLLVDDTGLPVESRPADGPHFMDILNPQVHAVRAGAFTQTECGVIGHLREILSSSG